MKNKEIDIDDNLIIDITPEMIGMMKQGKPVTLSPKKKYEDVPNEGALCYVWMNDLPEDYNHVENHTHIRVCKGKRCSSTGKVYFYDEGNNYSHSLWKFYKEIR